MINPLSNAALFLTQVICSFALLLFLLRLLLEWVNADIYNPFSQFLLKITSPMLKPLYLFFPKIRSFNSACFVVLLLIQVIKQLFSFFLVAQALPNFFGLLLIGVGELFSLSVDIFFFAILIQVILSWVAPYSHSALTGLIHSLVHPVLQPIQRIIPPLGGIDITPVVALLGLQLVNILVSYPLIQYGRALA